MGGGGDERILNGAYPFSGFHCHAILICICRSTLVSVWCEGDEPVRVGSKVLCNYEGRDGYAERLEPIGIVVGHDGSSEECNPWVVLVKKLDGTGYDYNYFTEPDIKVLDDFDSAQCTLSAALAICGGEERGMVKIFLSDLTKNFGKVHKELENE